MTTPFSVVGGFLGAGKTTWINQLLADPQGIRYGVLVNDFGDLAIDASLLQGDNREVVTLDNGCACCSIGNDLAAGIGRLQAMGMDHILLECSGVAIPGRLAELAKIGKNLQPHATITLINAASLEQLLADKWMADTYVKQLVSGGQLLANRLPHEGGLAKISEILLHANINQPLAEQALYSPAQWLQQPVGSKSVAAHSVAQMASCNLYPKSLAQAERWAKIAAEKDDIYRLKGFVATVEGSWLVQMVGQQLALTASPLEKPQTGLVAIGSAAAIASLQQQLA